MAYAITLEHGSDGSYLAWVHDLPGCSARGETREAVLAGVRDEIAGFREWLRSIGEDVAVDDPIGVVVAAEHDSAIEADEDTEVLLGPERAPLTSADWLQTERRLAASRAALLDSLARLPAERLDEPDARGTRTAREEMTHIAFVELMYAAWTFDLRTTDGLADFLAWTRGIATARMRALAERKDDSLTYAEWQGAPRPEPWTARKAARRLVWHERLHLP